ncbi:hypothetical protein [Salmonirosea aquatica]|uniref:Uncharacterized protein n=1 Tax=Salmonirosea aquatica TaxID=2654236 RepID=A0A7C9FFE4_9BACT|nr:hypothetical protein [Cytophagaceae bacterium SJW1-29]
MNKIQTIFDRMNPVEIGVLVMAISLTFVLYGTFIFILYNADNKRRKLFWLILILFFLTTMARIVLCSTGFIKPGFNLFWDTLWQAGIVLYLVLYVHRTYVRSQYMKSEGPDITQAVFFDTDALLQDLRHEGAIEYSGMKIELLSNEYLGVVASMRVQVLENMEFPYHYHKYTETIRIEAGMASVNGHALTPDSEPPIIPPYTVHNMSALAGTVFVSRLYDNVPSTPL